MSPLQTTFYDKVTSEGATQAYPLGTIRVEGSKTYKYVKASGAIANLAACTGAAAGTVKLHAASLKPIGANTRGAAVTDGYYFWMQVGGQVGPLDTSGATAAGYPLYATDASGVLTGAAVGGTAVGNSVVSVDGATGYGELSGLL